MSTNPSFPRPNFPGGTAIRPPKPPKALAIGLGVLVAAIIALVISSRVYTDLLFFREVGFSKVFTTIIWTKLLLFVVFGLLMAGAIAANVTIAYRLRPDFQPLTQEQQQLDRYRQVIGPRIVLITAGLASVFGLITGTSMTGSWKVWQLWLHGQSFGVKDPQFHKDISFFVFTYPFLKLVIGFLFAVLVLSTLVSAAVHYLFGGIRIQTKSDRVVPEARAHLSVLLGLLVLVKALAYWLDRYSLAFSGRGVVTGASYTDVHAALPSKVILASVAVICAALFFANAVRRNWALPGVAFGLLVISAVIIGGAYPLIVQQLRVKPNEVSKEAPYIQRNIEATRTAYGLEGADSQPYNGGAKTLPAKVSAADQLTLANIRLLDPNKLATTFEQLQQVRNYFGFPGSLDIDRYSFDGKTGDAIVAARELDQSGLSADQRNWINLHLIYTHGVGFVAAPAGAVDAQGRPAFAEKNVPQQGALKFTTSPRIYYGELSPDYSVVKTKQLEIDGPSDTGTSGQATNTYDGKGGVKLSGPLRKLLFAIRFKEKNLLLSSALTSESRIMFQRSPRARVAKVAPYLTIDGDPYPAVVNGRVTWILDGYTTSDGYPYSQRTRLGDATTDSTVTSANNRANLVGEVNYIRNSVKATVDAYDGTVTLYAFDPQDPVLRTWMKIFPGTVKSRADLDANTELVAHLRYPEDFFKVQRDLLAQYHVTDAKAFYSKEDFWAVPTEPNAPKGTSPPQPPYYLYMQVPGTSQGDFRLTTAMVARKRQLLAAFISVSSDPTDYGKLRILRLPSDTTVNGPAQVSNSFESDPKVSSALTLLRSAGSETVEGNLLTLPVGGGLLYIQPIYTKGTGTSAFPTLQKVIAGFGDKIGFGPTLADALAQVFTTSPIKPTPTTGNSGTGKPSSALAQAISDAQAAYKAGQEALAKGDFAAYGKAQDDLKAALDRAAAASK